MQVFFRFDDVVDTFIISFTRRISSAPMSAVEDILISKASYIGTSGAVVVSFLLPPLDVADEDEDS